MKDFHVYEDIRQRTNGEIYLGVVGPMRTGKSTFIRRFMEVMILPQMEEGPDKQRTRDELPQAGSGKMVMTTEPKFIPTKAARLALDDGSEMKVRMIDCVGFMVDGADGAVEENGERLIMTPWSGMAIPFSQAAETGTRKVIEEHSTLGIVVTTDGSIGDLPREVYRDPEEKTVHALKKLNKPFVILLNCREPEGEKARDLAKKLEQEYSVCVQPVNCEKMSMDDIQKLLEELLMEFPVCEVRYQIPDWLYALEEEHPVRKEMIRLAKEMLDKIHWMKDAKEALLCSLPSEAKEIRLGEMDMAQGTITYQIELNQDIYFRVISNFAGMTIQTEQQMMEVLREYAKMRERYAQVKNAMESVEQNGYGVIVPERTQILLEEPQVVKHGNRYGVKMKASAPSVHLIRSMVETEIAPIVGSEEQAKDLIGYINQNAANGDIGVWETNIFGKSIGQIVDDGIHAKINQMTRECQQKLQDAMRKIINDSNGGMICIII